MSISYFVYSPNQQTVTRSRMTDRLRSKGWTVVFVDPDNQMRILPEGPITCDLLLAADSQETADRMKEMIRGGDEKALDGLYARNKAASCLVTAKQPYHFNDDHTESDAQEMADAIGNDAVEAMRGATSCYEIYSSAHRSRPSYRFQESVWETVGELAGGLMEDPQSGSYQLCENGDRREIEAAGAPEETDPSDFQSLLTRFMERARERGFTVRGRGGKTEVVIDELDLGRMEQLLRLVDECMPPDEALFLGDMLLEEYVSKRDESFEADNRNWIEAMKNRRALGGSAGGGFQGALISLLRRLFRGKRGGGRSDVCDG